MGNEDLLYRRKMSSRELRRVIEAEERAKLAEENEEEEEEEEEEHSPSNNAVVNPFDLLADDDEEEGQEEEEQQPPKVAAPKEGNHTATGGSGGGARKRNNNNKRAKKKAARKKGKEKLKANKAEEEVEQLLQRFQGVGTNATQQQDKEGAVSGVSHPLDSLLALNPKNLFAENELTRLFGAKTLASLRKEEDSSPVLAYRSATGLSRKAKTVLVKPKPSWPPPPPDMEMELLDSKDGLYYFGMKWFGHYHRLQEQFMACVETGDPNTIAQLLQFHPYHLDSLLQLYDVCSHTGEREMAAELIERALFSFESYWHTLFYSSLLKGIARLEYTKPENRGFLVAIFHYIHMLGRRGCSATALEYCKMLLSLDPSDPLAIVLSIDYFCLRCQSYAYLLQFMEGPYYTKRFALIPGEKQPILPPNFAYSSALALFHLEREGSKKKEELLGRSADELLQRALLQYPMLLPPLLAKCSTRMSERDGNEATPYRSWEDIATHKFFSGPYNTASLRHVILLYVERTYTLWKSPDGAIMAWLKRNARAVLAKVDSKDRIVFEMSKKREAVAQIASATPVYNHILLTDIRAVVDALPAEAGRSFQLYEPELRSAGPTRQQQSVPAHTTNPLALFLSTLAPWATAPTGPPAAAPTNANEAELPPEAREWVRQLLAFLNTQGGQGGQQRGDEEEEEQH
ncbi:Transcription factor 25 [Balamuthia mandrillaris]